ncbi:DHHA2 domain-containing protein [Dryocola sp. BD613]|uniref:DHHA2 domain-containing protein n=1 Tax=Dryocola sp. BD613 TaxID=3133272 RepID=UPI003F509845
MTHVFGYIFRHAGLTQSVVLSFPPTGKPVWLVDFTEPGQDPADILQNNNAGIIDHHRLGGPIAKLPAIHAILLLGVLLSDTFNTNMQDDIRAGTEPSMLSGVNRRAVVHELLSAKTDVAGLSAEQLLDKDLKAFVIAGTDVRLAQLEITSSDRGAPLLNDLLTALALLADQTGAGLLMLTAIRFVFSTFYFAGQESVNAASCIAPGMLSRKQQLLPWPEAHLNQSRSQS